MQRSNRIPPVPASTPGRRRVPSPIDRAVGCSVESLESRWLLAVTATSANGVLTVVGDDNANAISVSRDVAGTLRVNNGAVAIVGPAATVANQRTANCANFRGASSVRSWT